MNTYFRALSKCRLPVELNDTWLRPIAWAYKINKSKLGPKVAVWFMEAYNWHEESHKTMLSQSRLFIAYDGALDNYGRDTNEFVNDMAMRMAESVEFWQGKVAPRVEMSIAFDDPERFPYQYVKWTTRLNIFNTVNYIRKHYTWISFSVLLVLVNILTIMLLGE